MKLMKIVLSGSLFLSLFSCIDINQMQADKKVKEESLLLLNVEGIIDSKVAKRFAKNVRTYAEEDQIKGVLVRMDSPGGTVSASQEINMAIREVSKRYKKPIYVSGGDVVASGGVLSIMQADQIFTNEGTHFGSIGVIGVFHNFSELAKWAKIERYSITSGEFKAAGNSYRKMTFRERELIENLSEKFHDQFKQAIIEGRKLEPKDVELFADGRVFTGADAVEYGLADKVGTFNDTIRALGEKTGLGSNPKLFDPNNKNSFENFFETFAKAKMSPVSQLVSYWVQLQSLSGKPVYLLPTVLPQ